MVTNIGGIIDQIIGAGVAGIGTGLSALFGSRAERKRQRELAKQEMKNNSIFDWQFFAHPMERASAQDTVRRMDEQGSKRLADARGRQAVTGGINVAAEKEAESRGRGELMAGLSANGDQFQQNELNRWSNVDNSISAQRGADYGRQVAANAQSGTNISTLAAGIAGGTALQDWYDSRKAKASTT